MCQNRFIYFDVADDSVRHHRLSSPEGTARRHHIDGTGFPSKCQKSLHFPLCTGVIMFWLLLSCVLITIFSWESCSFQMFLQGCYFCVKQYALECSRIPMGQTVNSQVNTTVENHIPPPIISDHNSPLEQCDLIGGAFSESVNLWSTWI